MYQYCLFDLDGTLTDSREGITKCVQYALRHYGIEEPDLSKLECFIGPPLVDSFMEFYHFTNEQAWEASHIFRQRFVPIGAYENKVFPGVPEMLQKMKEQGIRIAIASSKPEVSVRKILEHFELDQYFDVIVGSAPDGSNGAKEEIVERALSDLGVQVLSDEDRFSQCAMIGDRRFDIIGAKQHGVTAIGVRFGFADEGELEEAGADIIVDSMEDLQKLLLQDTNVRKNENTEG